MSSLHSFPCSRELGYEEAHIFSAISVWSSSDNSHSCIALEFVSCSKNNKNPETDIEVETNDQKSKAVNH